MGKSQWSRQNYFQIEVEFSAQEALLQIRGLFFLHVLEARVEKALPCRSVSAFVLKHDLVGKLRAWQVHCRRRAAEDSRPPSFTRRP